jgi:hypothetical protein
VNVGHDAQTGAAGMRANDNDGGAIDAGWVDVDVSTRDYGVGPTYYVFTFCVDGTAYTVTKRYAEVCWGHVSRPCVAMCSIRLPTNDL